MGLDSTGAGCDRWQEAISALLDGEDAGTVPTLVEAHVRHCRRCRTYQAQVARLRSLSQLRPVSGAEADEADEAGAIVRRLKAAERAGMRLYVRAGLAVVAVQILVLSLPDMWRAADGHEGRHVVSFTLTYTLALLLVVARPARARTVLPVAATLVASLAVTAVFDVARGDATWPGEAAHLPELVSLALVWMLARPPALPRERRRQEPGIRLVPSGDQAGELGGLGRSRSA